MAQTCIYKGLKIGYYKPAVSLVKTAGLWYNKDVVESRYLADWSVTKKCFQLEYHSDELLL